MANVPLLRLADRVSCLDPALDEGTTLKTAADALQIVDVVLYVLVGAVAVRAWRRTGGRAGAWAAAAFGAIAVVVVIGQVLPKHPSDRAEWVVRVLIVLLVLFPYLLYRFTTAFEEAAARVERVVAVPTAVMVVWTLALPRLPAQGEHRSSWFWGYVAGFVVHWTFLTAVSATRMLRAGRGQPTVAARRVRLLALAIVAITVALFVAIPGGLTGSVVSLVGACISTLSALAFAVALDPPAAVRLLWRRPEIDRMQRATADLLRAESESGVATGVLPAMARLVGASAARLRDADDRTLASYGTVPDTPALHTLPVGGGRLELWTSRLTPFFGLDELALLEALTALTSLALDHARLLGREREARAQLERADELKTQFVAYATHELRTPIASVVGLVETLERRGGELSPETRAQVQGTLGLQANRLRRLADQLLDLSKLDAEVVEIHPERVSIRSFAESIVETVAGDEPAIEVAIDPGLSAELDRDALALILTNLVTNALRYGRPPIHIGAAASASELRVSVADSGSGVPDAFVPQLFERFARSPESRRVEGGSGLGLAIARAYARAHHGDLLYAPDGGHGARFELVLPQ